LIADGVSILAVTKEKGAKHDPSYSQAEEIHLNTKLRDAMSILDILKPDNPLKQLECLFLYMHEADDSIELEELQHAVDQIGIGEIGEVIMGTIAEKLEAKGFEKGLLQGMREGEQQGIQQGIQEGIQDVAHKLLKEKVDPAFIVSVTGLPLADVQRMKSE